MQTLRLLLIGRGLYRQFLFALVLGGAALALAVAVLVVRETLSLPALFGSLGLAYTGCVVVMLIQLNMAGIALSALTVITGPVILGTVIAAHQLAQPAISSGSATLIGVSLLGLAALNRWRRTPT